METRSQRNFSRSLSCNAQLGSDGEVCDGVCALKQIHDAMIAQITIWKAEDYVANGEGTITLSRGGQCLAVIAEKNAKVGLLPNAKQVKGLRCGASVAGTISARPRRHR